MEYHENYVNENVYCVINKKKIKNIYVSTYLQIKHLFKICGSTALGYRLMFIRLFRFNRCFEKGFELNIERSVYYAKVITCTEYYVSINLTKLRNFDFS